MAKIIIIDDDNQFRNMLRQMLEGAGHEVIEACDGKEGMSLFEGNQIDLVITDIFMPEKEGIELIMEFRRNFPENKIIAVSGGGGNISPKEGLQMAKSLGVQYTFSKPFEREDLLDAVNELLKD